MMLSVTILCEAEAEFLEAAAYYENKAPGLGLDFAAEIERSVQAIRQSPERWFPFLVVYTCFNDHIWILAFAHCKRRPEYWSDRVWGRRES
jgi:toxin ParE1/3/4